MSEGENNVTRYSKERILGFKQFKNRADLLGVLLKNDGQYSPEEVEKELKSFLRKKAD